MAASQSTLCCVFHACTAMPCHYLSHSSSLLLCAHSVSSPVSFQFLQCTCSHSLHKVPGIRPLFSSVLVEAALCILDSCEEAHNIEVHQNITLQDSGLTDVFHKGRGVLHVRVCGSTQGLQDSDKLPGQLVCGRADGRHDWSQGVPSLCTFGRT